MRLKPPTAVLFKRGFSKSNTNPGNSKLNTTYSQYKHTQKIQNQTQPKKFKIKLKPRKFKIKHNIFTIETHPENSKSNTT